ncbi:MAG: hypothetical protein RAK18_08035, partial [Conexivisphaerales archaeon]|nr:hypothetical protein [Conexivisphaerales archaeon]
MIAPRNGPRMLRMRIGAEVTKDAWLAIASMKDWEIELDPATVHGVCDRMDGTLEFTARTAQYYPLYRVAGAPAIPGSTLKGFVRARLLKENPERAEDLLGRLGRPPVGGRATFRALLVEGGARLGTVNESGATYEVVLEGSRFSGWIHVRGFDEKGLEEDAELILSALGCRNGGFEPVCLGRFCSKRAGGNLRFALLEPAHVG